MDLELYIYLIYIMRFFQIISKYNAKKLLFHTSCVRKCEIKKIGLITFFSTTDDG